MARLKAVALVSVLLLRKARKVSCSTQLTPSSVPRAWLISFWPSWWRLGMHAAYAQAERPHTAPGHLDKHRVYGGWPCRAHGDSVARRPSADRGRLLFQNFTMIDGTGES